MRTTIFFKERTLLYSWLSESFAKTINEEFEADKVEVNEYKSKADDGVELIGNRIDIYKKFTPDEAFRLLWFLKNDSGIWCYVDEVIINERGITV